MSQGHPVRARGKSTFDVWLLFSLLEGLRGRTQRDIKSETSGQETS